MVHDDPEELRKEVHRLIAAASSTADHDEKRKLSSRAFVLAQQAEAMERTRSTAKTADTKLDGNFKTIADSNIQRFVERLYIEREGNQRELFRKLLLWEERWYGLKQERLETIRRLLHDCDGRILRYRRLFDEQQAAGVATRDAHLLLDNLLDVQRFLRISFRAELVREDTEF